MKDFERKHVVQMIAELTKWQLETAENIHNQYFGLRPLTIQINLMQDLALFIAKFNIPQDEWEKMYIEGADKARKEFLNTVTPKDLI